MKRACIIGWPVSHSLSPVIHGYWLKKHRVEGAYERKAVKPHEFEDFVRHMSSLGLCGGNVTVPHKQAAFGLVDRATAAAQHIGAVNTVWIDGGKLYGDNTDAFGFLENLDDIQPKWDHSNIHKVIVIGAGGAARAVLHGLIERGVENIAVLNRTLKRATDLAQDFPPAQGVPWDERAIVLEEATLIINASTLGMDGFPALDLTLEKAAPSAIVYDIVYHPLETPLLAEAKRLGLKTVDGLGMLLHQAAPGFERWFDVMPDVTPDLRLQVLNAITELKKERP